MTIKGHLLCVWRLCIAAIRRLGAPAALFTLAVVSVAAEPPRGKSEPASDLRQVREDWRRRRGRAHSVRYRLTGTSTILKGRLVDADPSLPPGTPRTFPQTDYTHDVKVTWLLDFERSLLRREKHSQTFMVPEFVFHPAFTTHVFDGAVFKALEPRAKNTSAHYVPDETQPELLILRDRTTLHLFTAFSLPIMFAHGLFPLSGTFNPRDFGALSVDKLTLQVHGHAVVDGRRCVVLRAYPKVTQHEAGYDEFWVDPTRDSAVLRWERHSQGRVFARLEITYTKRGNDWLPQTWTTTFYIAGRTPPSIHNVDRATVEEVCIDPITTANDFRLAMAPGMVVRNTITRTSYRVAVDGKTLEPWSGRPQTGSEPRRLSEGLLAAIVTGTAFVVLAGAALLCRRRRRCPAE